MATPIKGNAIIGQSGGPTSVINQSLVGVILEARKVGFINKLYGARHGIRGIKAGDFIELNAVPEELLERIAQTPAAALGSTRDKPKGDDTKTMFEVFQKHGVNHFFYIGGNDSADTARIIGDLAKQAGHDLTVWHVPKTIDNDLRVHDHTPGYGSAARYVASALIGDNFDNKSLPGVKIDVVMGRDAGFLTAAAVLARRHPEDGPHLIYVPEVPLTEDKFVGDVDRVFTKHGRCLVAVSEGVRRPDGKLWTKAIVDEAGRKLQEDQHKNTQLSGTGALGDFLSELVKTRLGETRKDLRVRADTLGYPQRSFPGYVSEVDAREARLVGTMAVRYANEGVAGGSVAMRRTGGSEYGVETFVTPLDTVARETKHLDPSWVRDGNDITDAFKAYAAPLVGKLPVVGAFDELR